MDNSIPWIEKYRPNKLKDIIIDENIEKQINVFLENRNGTHLIITGIPGIGKTTTVRCIAKHFLGENIKDGYLELNSGDERGGKNITSIIPCFCNKKVSFDSPKIILFDEADNMITKCQTIVSRLMEVHGKKTRFIFTCNNSAKIIEDIQSMCSIINFRKMSNEQTAIYLKKICDSEEIKYTDNGIELISYISDGDMRKSVNNLQKIAYAFGSISKSNVLKICHFPDPNTIEQLLEHCKNLELKEADRQIIEMIDKGYYYIDIINGFIFVIDRYKTEEINRIKLLEIVNKIKINICIGIHTKLQMSAMVCKLTLEMSKKIEK